MLYFDPMKILHVTPTYLPATRYGGPIRSVHGLCKALGARGHDVDVFTTNVDGPGESDVPVATPTRLDGVTVWYFPSTWLRRLYWSPQMGSAAGAHQQYDIVHIHSLYLWPTWAAARRPPQWRSLCAGAARHVDRSPDSPQERVAQAGLDPPRRREEHPLRRCSQMTAELEVEEAKQFNIKLPRMVVVPKGRSTAGAGGRCPQRTVAHLLFLSRINWKRTRSPHSSDAVHSRSAADRGWK